MLQRGRINVNHVEVGEFTVNMKILMGGSTPGRGEDYNLVRGIVPDRQVGVRETPTEGGCVPVGGRTIDKYEENC